MTPPREDATRRAVLKYLRTLGPGVIWRSLHGDGYGPIGDPDLILSVGGHCVCLELKRAGWHATPAWRETPQARRLHAWQATGATVAVVTSVEEARDVIEPILAELADAYAVRLASAAGNTPHDNDP
jgi:hypothetical protein